jgi:DNA recombination protein RmuC
MTVIYFAIGALAGALLLWLAVRPRLRDYAARMEADQRTAAERLAIERKAAEERLALERKAADEKLALVEQSRSVLEERLKALSADALQDNRESFLALASAKVEPLEAALKKIDETVRALERARSTDTGSVRTQLDALTKETQSLSRALSTPDTIGSWGQIQLRRVIELAGMLEHCDFGEQVSMTTDEGRRQRPDVLVHLPGGAVVVVDAKVPRSVYLAAQRAEDDGERRECLKRHARLVRKHMSDLGSKGYWQQFPIAPECVVMFVPHEPFISEACREDDRLIEDGFSRDRVIIATPMTLIALLLGFATGWRQVKTQEHAEEVALQGRDLYRRVGKFGEHFRDLGKCITQSVDAYNKTVGSLETRLLPAARQFPRLLSNTDAEHPLLQPIDQRPRDLQAVELVEPHGEDDLAVSRSGVTD